jgi:hypothetical protein
MTDFEENFKNQHATGQFEQSGSSQSSDTKFSALLVTLYKASTSRSTFSTSDVPMSWFVRAQLSCFLL